VLENAATSHLFGNFLETPTAPTEISEQTCYRWRREYGRIKMRARTVRDYKTRAGMLNGLLVSSVILT
jgi:hypothetical protein